MVHRASSGTPTTIAAIASPPGAGRRGVVRLSGPRAGEVVARTCRAAGEPLRPAARGIFTARFDDGRGEQPALVLWMPGPRSFTREDVAELHLPGSPPLLAAALERVLALGAEPAAPGEFTRRAFENGRIDLTRAEGVLALVAATSEEERRAATALLVGGLDGRVAALRERLEALRALCEASLDFDESDTGHVPADELLESAARLGADLDEALAWEERRAPASGEPRVVLVGRPNAGKSALFNALTGVEEGARSIVSDLAGTTRDARAAAWRPGGLPSRLIDTAGLEGAPLRSVGDGSKASALTGPAASASERALAERSAAALVLWVVDGSRTDQDTLLADVRGWEAERPRRVLVWNKTDLPRAGSEPPAALAREAASWIAASATSGTGLDELCAAVALALGAPADPRSRDAGSGAARAADAAGAVDAAGAGGAARDLDARHRACLRDARVALARAADELVAGAPLDLFAEGLRGATERLDRITGRTTPEDLLDRIFARFCIGK